MANRQLLTTRRISKNKGRMKGSQVNGVQNEGSEQKIRGHFTCARQIKGDGGGLIF